MKRITAFILAGIVAAGMSLPAFAVGSPELVYADDGAIDLSGGETVEAAEDIEEIEAYIGEGVTITTAMVGGETYRGVATDEPDADDGAVMDNYPDIAYALNLRTSGLNARGDTVTIDAEEDFYVYDRDLKYLGRASEPLPYKTKYYLAEAELTDPNAEPTDASQPSTEPATPGNSTSGGNPDTGDVSFLGVALAALVVSGAAIAILVLRRKKN